MTRRKFKRNSRKYKKSLDFVRNLPVSIKNQPSGKLTEHKNQFTWSEDDRLTYVYKTNNKGEIKEVTCVSCEILISDQWVTIVYYDNVHNGVLHRHIRTSMDDSSGPATTIGVTKKADCKQQLTWAIRNLRNFYLDYKKSFLKRSKKYLVRNNLKIYY